MLSHVSAEDNIIQSRQGCVTLLNKRINDLDQASDKQRFLELYNQAFSLPKKFEFQAHKGDEVWELGYVVCISERIRTILKCMVTGPLKEVS